MTARITPPPPPGAGDSDPDRSISNRPTWVLPPIPRITAVPLNPADLGEMGQPAKPTVPFGSPTVDWSDIGTVPMTPDAELQERVRQLGAWIERHLAAMRACRQEANRVDGEIKRLRAEQYETRQRWEWARVWVTLPPQQVAALSAQHQRTYQQAQGHYQRDTDTLLRLDAEIARRRQAWVACVERAREHERAAYGLRQALESEAQAWR